MLYDSPVRLRTGRSPINRAKRTAIFTRLRAENPEPTTELDFRTYFELLIAVMLSAQATDVGLNRATAKLFPAARTPAAMLELGLDRLKDFIRTIGLFNTKAKNILKTCRILLDGHGGEVPRRREPLEALPGVGRKTANVVLNTAFGEPTIAVDTHIFRVCNRTGIAPGKTPRKVDDALLRSVPGRIQARRAPLADPARPLRLQRALAALRSVRHRGPVRVRGPKQQAAREVKPDRRCGRSTPPRPPSPRIRHSPLLRSQPGSTIHDWSWPLISIAALQTATGVGTQCCKEALMKGLLARVGLDSTERYGGANAPMKPDRSFLYVPIPETDPQSGVPLEQRRGMETRYTDINTGRFTPLHPKLMKLHTHLSPDFKHLNFCTYDLGGKCLEPLTKGDFVLFFAGLEPTEGPRRPLAYVLIGQMFVRDKISFDEVPEDEYHKYADTRCLPGFYDRQQHHYILRADRKRSGRYSRCSSPFAGPQDDLIYRVFPKIWNRWGGLRTYTGKQVKGRAVQRTGGGLWSFGEPEEALKWVEKQDTGKLHRSNW